MGPTILISFVICGLTVVVPSRVGAQTTLAAPADASVPAPSADTATPAADPWAEPPPAAPAAGTTPGVKSQSPPVTPPPAPDTASTASVTWWQSYRQAVRAHVDGRAAGVGLGGLGTSLRQSAQARTGLEGGGGFTMDLFGQVSAVMFGGDFALSPYSDPNPEYFSTTGGQRVSELSAVTGSLYAGPSLPVLTPVTFLGVYAGYMGTTKVERRVGDCLNCDGPDASMRGGFFTEASAFVRFRGLGLSLGYRWFPAPSSDIASTFSVRLFAYMDRAVAALLDGR
jgi:hypothetical protein